MNYVPIHGVFSSSSDLPYGATMWSEKSGIKVNQIATATHTPASSKTSYLLGFNVTGSGATVGLSVTVDTTGLTVNMSHVYTASGGVLVANAALLIFYGRGIPASAVDTAISVSCPALGLGNLNNAVNIWGYDL